MDLNNLGINSDEVEQKNLKMTKNFDDENLEIDALAEFDPTVQIIRGLNYVPDYEKLTFKKDEHMKNRPRIQVYSMVSRNKKDKEGNMYQELLLTTRKEKPFKGKFAFPGGFLIYNEDPTDASKRILQESCSLNFTLDSSPKPDLFSVKGRPDREGIEGHVVAFFYLFQIKHESEIIKTAKQREE